MEAPKCGVRIIFGADINGLSTGKGSDSNTSNAAPAILFSVSAFDKSSSLIIPPLATLMILAPFFIFIRLL